ncbi:MAG: SH3 domain-containing protein [Spirochaetales bacterium]|nr:SH3 domain-containing protein [Spirochaetales bacterium]
MTGRGTAIGMILLLAAAAGLGAAPTSMSVTVRETQARATPSFLGPVVAVLVYGDRLEVLEEQRGWLRVTLTGGRQGWVNKTALTEKRIVLASGSEAAQAEASGSEVALAGKGFNEQVEAQYKAENELDYAWVDRMEGFVVSPQEVVGFVEAGGLLWMEGGAQ